MRPEYQNLHSYFREIKEQYAQAKTTQEKLDLLKIASEILKQAQEQVAQLQDEIDGMRKSWVDFERRDTTYISFTTSRGFLPSRNPIYLGMFSAAPRATYAV